MNSIDANQKMVSATQCWPTAPGADDPDCDRVVARLPEQIDAQRRLLAKLACQEMRLRQMNLRVFGEDPLDGPSNDTPDIPREYDAQIALVTSELFDSAERLDKLITSLETFV